MTAMQLFLALGGAEDRFVLEAEQPPKPALWKPIAVAAAALLVVLGAVWAARTVLAPPQPPALAQETTAPAQSTPTQTTQTTQTTLTTLTTLPHGAVCWRRVPLGSFFFCGRQEVSPVSAVVRAGRYVPTGQGNARLTGVGRVNASHTQPRNNIKN